MRLPQPVTVGLTQDTPPDGAVRVTRRGIPLDPRRDPFWPTPSLDDWSLVVDFGHPVSEVSLELVEGHDLVFATGAANGPFPVTGQVPVGAAPRLTFASPADQLRLRGTGFLHALRVSTANRDPVEVSVVLPPIPLVDTPLPAAPLTASATSLQAAQPVPAGPVMVPEVPSRHVLGFRVSWRPAPAFGITAWPPALEAAPPLAAATFQVERRVEPASP